MRFLLLAAASLGIVANVSAAQDGASRAGGTANPGPPIRILGPALASTTEGLGTVAQVRALPGGRVLVNDGARRRLLLFDSAMALIKIVADSSSTSSNPYGPRAGKLMAFSGDSSLLLDAGSLSMLVIDGDGNIVKVKAIPRTEHATYLTSAAPTYGIPGFDAQGRLVYKVNDPIRFISVAAGGGLMVPEQPDSSPILRMDMATRKLDTVGRIKLQKRITEPVSMQGFMTTRTLTNPMPVQDDWAVTSDGAVAFLRHRDYSIDWLNPDGTRTSSPPMPFDWQRLTDEHKKAFADSVLVTLLASQRNMLARYDSINATCFKLERTIFADPPPPPVATAPAVPDRAVTVAGDGRGVTTTTRVTTAGGRGADVGTTAGGRGADAGAAAAGRGAATPSPPPPVVAAPACPPTPYPLADMFGPAPKVVPYQALPDYKPPFSANAMRSDADANVWIRVNQMKPVAGTYHYDIVNRKGELFDRMQIPIARAVVGHGPGGIVYVTSRSGTPPVLKLERVRWR